jgi:hypothetical protein
MRILLVRAILILSVALGASGGAVGAAAGSVPEAPLHALERVMEQHRLWRVADPAEEAALHMRQVQVRVQELIRMATAGQVPDEPALVQLRLHLNQALRLAAGMPEEAMQRILSQAGEMIRNQERLLTQVRSHVGGQPEEPLQRALQALAMARERVQAGVEDPAAFRWQYGYGPGCPEEGCEPPGDQYGYGPRPEGPGPGQPGGNPDCPEEGCEPPGDQYGYGPRPEGPGPGQPGGNPDCPEEGCEPPGDQYGYGPGQPGGNPDCPEGGCEPEGDQHHHGQPQPPGGGGGNSGETGGKGKP